MNRYRMHNNLWAGANLLRWRRFRRALGSPAAAQENLLRGYLRKNAATEFGRKHGFASIGSVEEYRRKVPLSGYDDYQSAVERIRQGGAQVLTRERVRRLVPTGGSTAARKLIPWTGSLQAEFNRAIGPWIVDLYRRRPELRDGPAYWSLSPALDSPEEGESAVPIGFDTDSAYLGGWLNKLVAQTMAVPPSVRFVRDVNVFRYVTLLFLLRARELRLISVWHPSFLTLLLGPLPEYWNQLLSDIAHGCINPPGKMDAHVRRTLEARLAPDPGRAGELRDADPYAPRTIWPRLSLISCWGDGHASNALADLRQVFPGVEIQRKGLVSTEAFVTVPFDGAYPVAVTSHFYEFLDDGGRSHLADELQIGSEYSVVVTTGGGLYRYRLYDRVLVEGFVARTPALRFLGKEDRVSDRFGEKLSDAFVAGALRRVLDPLALRVRFAMLAPDRRGERIGYTVYLESEEAPPPEFAALLDDALSENPQYAYCRRLGQLAPAAVFRISSRAQHTYLENCGRQGRRLGEIKPSALSCESGWSDVFAGSYQGAPQSEHSLCKETHSSFHETGWKETRGAL